MKKAMPLDNAPHTEPDIEIPIYDVANDGTRTLRTEQPPRPYARAVRGQFDDLGDVYSEMTRLDTGRETPTRQEYAHEADISNILKKYGVPMHQVPARNGETDWNLDLQSAIMAVDAAKNASYNVPVELISTYPTWVKLLQGIESGHYQRDLADLQERKAAAAKTETETVPKAP